MVRTRACTRERGWVNEVRAGLRRAARGARRSCRCVGRRSPKLVLRETVQEVPLAEIVWQVGRLSRRRRGSLRSASPADLKRRAKYGTPSRVSTNG